jgi:coatomer protein complex subunit gamma
MLELLEGWLRHKSDMVNFEAARVICEMKNVSTVQLSRAIGGESAFIAFFFISQISPVVLQLFLSSPKATLRFAATRTLATLAILHPSSVAVCNVDLENLISDANRSVATYAITTLLKVHRAIINSFTNLTVCRLEMKLPWID